MHIRACNPSAESQKLHTFITWLIPEGYLELARKDKSKPDSQSLEGGREWLPGQEGELHSVAGGCSGASEDRHG